MLHANQRLTELYFQSDSCVRCGRCTTVCPTYRVTRREPMVARGRIWLARQFVEGRLGLSSTLKLYNDSCLGCQACRAVCPPGIKVDELVAEVKQTIQGRLGLTLEDKMILKACSHPQSFRYLVGTLDLSRRMGTTRLLPKRLRQKVRMFPQPPPRTFMDWLKLQKTPDTAGRPKIGYFPGCLTNSIFPGIAMAVLEVLKPQGVQVVVPPAVLCCGQPHRVAGELTESRRLAIAIMNFFLGQGVDFVVTSCGSCGYSLQEYAADFRDDPIWREPAERFAGKCRDIMEYLVGVAGLSVGPQALPGITVTYHDSCHLNRRLGIAAQPRELLAALPGARYAEMPRADWCCGAAGSYSFRHPDIARKILALKTEDARSIRPDVVTAGCPSCLMQLGYGSRIFDGNYDVCHPVELLAATFDHARNNRWLSL
ncbi:MAG: (Fe-S)-binding protein [Syntrophobacteraceae bacterium]